MNCDRALRRRGKLSPGHICEPADGSISEGEFSAQRRSAKNRRFPTIGRDGDETRAQEASPSDSPRKTAAATRAVASGGDVLVGPGTAGQRAVAGSICEGAKRASRGRCVQDRRQRSAGSTSSSRSRGTRDGLARSSSVEWKVRDPRSGKRLNEAATFRCDELSPERADTWVPHQVPTTWPDREHRGLPTRGRCRTEDRD
jgi:hypothetical protein